MIAYIARRLGSGLVLIFVVTAITFFLTYGANLPVARNILGPNAGQDQLDALNAKLGLDRPIFEQYFSWLGGVFRGDLGASYFNSQPVVDAMASRLPVTMSVVVVAAVITLIMSVVLGVASAAKRGALDVVLQAISTIAFVFPAIVLGIVLVYVFAISLHWVPAIGFVPFSDSPGGWFASIILPAVVLSIGGIAALAAQIRGSLIDELSRDYVRTLRSRGTSEGEILLKHALRNAAGPALTTFSLQFITMFGAALFVEKIFALPGYGNYAFQATVQGDLPVMLGVILFSVVLVVIVNLLVDLANGWLNPKVRVS
ncbi:ABC transporter permease [Leifsonia sp. Root4]|uniref:ABC transporter permease n=1 Tax=Leifsonia sp. Root4 TaxID=1736525 RepID=UPI0006F7F026|nr:ABC transporter permease [Leifsonia sp. Root4]KQW05577.1 ABC transporter permease [Leifsonia sp. Root4]